MIEEKAISNSNQVLTVSSIELDEKDYLTTLKGVNLKVVSVCFDNLKIIPDKISPDLPNTRMFKVTLPNGFNVGHIIMVM